MKINKLNKSESQTEKINEDDLPGYPLYPENEDIYNNFKEEKELDPEDVSKTKSLNSTNALRRKELDNDFSDEDLDVPGSELDDEQEAIGSEDEENNYYSLGGDDHNNLDEDSGNLD